MRSLRQGRSTTSHGWTQIVERYDWSEDNSAELAKGWIKTADSLPALAALLGLDPAALVDTITRWNRCCDAKRPSGAFPGGMQRLRCLGHSRLNLASDDAGFMTGAGLVVDGGLTAQ
jgi:hypothetical protein